SILIYPHNLIPISKTAACGLSLESTAGHQWKGFTQRGATHGARAYSVHGAPTVITANEGCFSEEKNMLKFNQRNFIAAALPAAAMAFGMPAAADSDWPNRAIQMYVPSAAGGGADTVARLIGKQIGRAHV